MWIFEQFILSDRLRRARSFGVNEAKDLVPAGGAVRSGEMPVGNMVRDGRQILRRCPKLRKPAWSTRAPQDKVGEQGFTLAGLIVILTIMMIFIAYTVPVQWSKIMQRERERQTVFVMRQYARAIREWSKKNGAMPVKLDQIKEARLPRMIRGPKGELIDPLTGKFDWIMIPPGAVTAAQGAPQPGIQQGAGPGQTSTTGTQSSTAGSSGGASTTFNAAASPNGYVGPFIGVRPAISGPSMLSFNGNNDYGQWYFTTLDLEAEIQRATMPNPNAKP